MNRVVLVLILSVLLFTSCTDTTLDTDHNTSVNTPKCVTISESEVNKSWDIDMLLMIAESYDLSCGELEFNSDNPPEFCDIFPYFIKVGCYNSYTRSMRDEILEYYDFDNQEISVPCEIADKFLSDRFNTVVDRGTISFYDPKEEVYNFKVRQYEYYYEQVVIDFTINDDDSIVFDVAKYHALSDSLAPTRTRYCVVIEQGRYQILFVEQLDSVSLLNEDMALTYKNGKVSMEENDGSEHQRWWLVPSSNNGEYTIRPISDGKYFLTVSSDGNLYAEWFRDETIVDLVTYDSKTGYVYCTLDNAMMYIGSDGTISESAVMWDVITNDSING